MNVETASHGAPFRDGPEWIFMFRLIVRMTEKEYDAFDGLAIEAHGWTRFRLTVRKAPGGAEPEAQGWRWEIRNCRDFRARQQEAPVVSSGSRESWDLALEDGLACLRLVRLKVPALVPSVTGEINANAEEGAR